MVDPNTNTKQAKPTVSSRKRQAPETSTSAKKKHKIDLTHQEVNKNSTEVAREDTPDFEEFFERENFSLHIDEEDDEDALGFEDDSNYEIKFVRPSVDVNDDSSMEDNDDDSDSEDDFEVPFLEPDLKDNNGDSNTNAGNLSNTVKPKPKPKPKPKSKSKRKRDPKDAFPWLTRIILNPIDRNSTPESNIDDLNDLRYCKLKRMRTDPEARAQYGDEALITACRTANFSRMTLDQLYEIPREKIPKKHHGILDDVIHTKELAVDNGLDGFARDEYYSEGSRPLLNEHWRVTEYVDALRSQIPGPRYH